MSEATSEEIINILKYLKNGAPEYDQINASWLNHIASFINKALRWLSYLFLSKCVFLQN